MALPNIGIDANLNGAIPFSANSAWNERVDTAPLVANSAAIIAQLAPGVGIHPDFGSGGIGIPYVVVPANQPLVPFNNNLYPSESDQGPYPIPANAPIEGASDAHMIIVQQDPNSANGIGKIYETFATQVDSQGNYSGFGAVFDGSSTGGDLQRPVGHTSADAAGLPIFPGLLTYDEVQQAITGDGVVHHAIRVTFSQALLQQAFISPAEHQAGTNNGVVPFGTRLRLDPNYVIPADTTPENRVILQTMKEYGLIVADNGSNWFISGAPDNRWNNDQLHNLLLTTGSNFQVVDASHLQPTSSAIRQQSLLATTGLSIAFHSRVSFSSPTQATLTGTITGKAGLTSVELFEGSTDLGAASVNPNGTWSFTGHFPRGFHTGFRAVATDTSGNSVSAASHFDLTTGGGGEGYTAFQDRYSTDGRTFLGQTLFKRHGAVYMKDSYSTLPDGRSSYTYSGGAFFKDKPYSSFTDSYDAEGTLTQHVESNRDGSHSINGIQNGQVLSSIGNDTFVNDGRYERFVFSPGFGHDTITDFQVDGRGHDTIVLPSWDMGHLAQIIGRAQTVGGDTTFHIDHQDSITLQGVTVAELKAHPHDFRFHG